MSDFIIGIGVLFLLIGGTALICLFMNLFINLCDRVLLEIEARKYGKDFPYNIKEINKRLGGKDE